MRSSESKPNYFAIGNSLLLYPSDDMINNKKQTLSTVLKSCQLAHILDKSIVKSFLPYEQNFILTGV